MAYDYTPRQIEQWPSDAAAEIYRQKYLNAQRNAALWQRRCEQLSQQKENAND
ncbi:hypothetical protein GCM10023063_28420 [Arthrobacter methylotrophus]|uniref:Uncharacterized protein n=1 Tax=Arthrobacter methylotrophus TaxID=121291 RepID=A0ABV5UQJ7_9MICC